MGPAMVYDQYLIPQSNTNTYTTNSFINFITCGHLGNRYDQLNKRVVTAFGCSAGRGSAFSKQKAASNSSHAALCWHGWTCKAVRVGRRTCSLASVYIGLCPRLSSIINQSQTPKRARSPAFSYKGRSISSPASIMGSHRSYMIILLFACLVVDPVRMLPLAIQRISHP